MSVKDEMILRLVVFLFTGWICRVNGKNIKCFKKTVKAEHARKKTQSHSYTTLQIRLTRLYTFNVSIGKVRKS